VNQTFSSYRVALFAALLLCACGSDKRPNTPIPVETPPEDAQQSNTEDSGKVAVEDSKSPPPESKPAQPEDVIRLVESMAQYLEPCANQLLSPDVMNLRQVSVPVHDRLLEHCNLADKIFPESTDAAIGVARSVDEALLAYAGLNAEIEHLLVLIGGSLDIPDSAFSNELEARLLAVRRTISNSRNTIRRARKDVTGGTLGDGAVQALPVLLREPRLFLNTVASLVDGSVIGLPRQTMIRDVRTRLLKGRPIAFTQDRVSIRVARSRFRKVAAVLQTVAKDRPIFRNGLPEYIAAVEAYLTQLDAILQAMKEAQTYDQRSAVMKRLQRLARYERKEITTRHQFWRANIEDALLSPQVEPKKP
tara:strand:- start:487 stop:1572 length:1086 start_codon:yes stop_codon:yes gene_type:complete